MELDSLKDIWKNLDEQDLRSGSDVSITSMLHKRSKSPVAKMKRTYISYPYIFCIGNINKVEIMIFI